VKIHWLSDGKHKANWDEKENIKSFCDSIDGVEFMYERYPKSHFIIIDIQDSNEVAIKQFALDRYGLSKYKITKRSNKVEATNRIKRLLYLNDLKPVILLYLRYSFVNPSNKSIKFYYT
jgi:hypothetical protein